MELRVEAVLINCNNYNYYSDEKRLENTNEKYNNVNDG